MTYLDLFAECLSIVTHLPAETFKQRMHEYQEHVEPNPILDQEAPKEVSDRLLKSAIEHTEHLLDYLRTAIPHAFDALQDKTKH